jgi:hypothetical protein
MYATENGFLKPVRKIGYGGFDRKKGGLIERADCVILIVSALSQNEQGVRVSEALCI